MKNGIFNGCLDCTDYCCMFKRKETTIQAGLTDTEIRNISSMKNLCSSNFVEYVGENKAILKSTSDGYCVFVGTYGCILKDDRPKSCKTYPYQVGKCDGEYYLYRSVKICKTNDWLVDDYSDLYELMGDSIFTSAVENIDKNFDVVQICKIPNEIIDKLHIFNVFYD